jgi:hypothetical protein
LIAQNAGADFLDLSGLKLVQAEGAIADADEAVHGQAMIGQRACLMQLSGVIGGEKRLGS